MSRCWAGFLSCWLGVYMVFVRLSQKQGSQRFEWRFIWVRAFAIQTGWEFVAGQDNILSRYPRVGAQREKEEEEEEEEW